MTKGETFHVREGQTFHMFPDIDSAPKHFLCAWCRRPLGEHDRRGLEAHVEAARMALQTLEREGSAQRATDAQGWRIIRVMRVEPPGTAAQALSKTDDPRTFSERLQEKVKAVAAAREATTTKAGRVNPYKLQVGKRDPLPDLGKYKVKVPEGKDGHH
jgi:hypothetical protein